MPNSPLAVASSLAWTVPIAWLGDAGYHQLDGQRHARLALGSLRTVPRADSYNGMSAAIVSKTHGQIDHNSFLFDDHLAERSDERPDWQQRQRGQLFTATAIHGNWSWSIAVPATTRPFTEAVEAWFDLYR